MHAKQKLQAFLKKYLLCNEFRSVLRKSDQSFLQAGFS